MTRVTRIATICARAGSQGLPGKNLAELDGIPLFMIAIEQAAASRVFDEIVVTSNDPEVIRLCQDRRIDVVHRPDHLASNAAPKLPAIRHAVEEVERRIDVVFDTVVDLDVTTPLRSVDDIHAVVKLLESGGWGNIVTASPAHRNPYFNQVEVLDDKSVRLVAEGAALYRRQDCPLVFDLSGAVYAWRRDVLFSDAPLLSSETQVHVIPRIRAWDIDDPLDLTIVRTIAAHPELQSHAGTRS